MDPQPAHQGATAHSIAISDADPVPIYDEAFAADPHGAYKQMRETFGPLVPVEMWPGVPATLVIKYRTAVRILNDHERFPADPSIWQKTAPANIPIMPMVEALPNAIRTSGAKHDRYRSALNSALSGINLYSVPSAVENAAVPLINNFCTNGNADVLNEYILPLVFSAFCEILGCPPDIGERVAHASAAMFDGVDTETVNANMGQALLDLTALKRAHPADDVTTRLVQHPADLDDEEMVQQLVLLFAAGVEPPVNLIANTLLLMLTDSRFTSSGHTLALSTETALDERLATDPPMANYCITYPRQPSLIEGVWLPADQPVIISLTACNTDPELTSGDYLDNGWNLAFSSGEHACPVAGRSWGRMVSREGIDQLLDKLPIPELQLAVPEQDLVWRPGPFHRSLTTMPLQFPPTTPFVIG